MERRRDYGAFIKELTAWGDEVLRGQQKGRAVPERFFGLLEKEEQGVQNSVFSPFLYLALSAELEAYETLFLGAVLWHQMRGGGPGTGAFTFRIWEKFLQGEEDADRGLEIFCCSCPLLLERWTEKESGEMAVRIVQPAFLFLSRNFLPERKIPGLVWYYRMGDRLPSAGKSQRAYLRMKSCMEQIPGKKLFYLRGGRGSGRKLSYAWLAAESGRSMVTVSFEELQGREHLTDLLVECLLHHAMLVIELPERETGMEELTSFLSWMREEKSVFLAGEWKEFPLREQDERQYLSFRLDTQEVLEDRELYERMAAGYSWENEKVMKEFLGRYAFLPGKMKDILELAGTYALSERTNCITKAHLRQAVLGASSHSLEKYAREIRSVYTMGDLILPSEQKQKLLHILNRVRNHRRVYEEWGFLEKSAYGNGVSMVFAGPPGTGKTMAAQVIASELGMELYRVELPSVVDKYIGETQKKLNRIFEEAQKSTAILFFDEADVLFGKRTEIRESNDRYSNMEIAFLLQKMEEHEGVSILATNYLQNFDEAFRRRIGDIVDFPMPDQDQREQMWRTMLPERLPVSEEMDYVFLAKQFPVTGSVIKNALIYGSFLAAESPGQTLTMKEVLQGLGHELEKSGRKLGREDYGEYSHLFRPERSLE